MLHEKINLGNSGYGTRDTILTTYVQNNLEGVHARRRPAVIICPGGGYEYQSDRESEPIALEFFATSHQNDPSILYSEWIRFQLLSDSITYLILYQTCLTPASLNF